ncbi:MAG: Hsp20/alpha crystallin family protein [Methanobacteriaceae archaeon]|jgi:HSP20 family protein|nr:Hsp20/alpha crystallin family protein [Methanobacteriaceae archaeon]
MDEKEQMNEEKPHLHREKVKEDIHSGKERAEQRAEKSKTVVDRVSTDLGKSMEDLMVTMKGVQKSMDSRFQDYRETTPSKLDLDLIDAGDYYYLKVFLPGVDKEKIEVEATVNEVTVKAEFPSTIDDIDRPCASKPEYLIKGIRTGEAKRTVRLPAKIKIKEITAKFKLGTVFLEIPKVQEETYKVDLN